MANTKKISGHQLNPDGRMVPTYNRPKRFLRALFRKAFLPSLITAGVVVGAFALIPALSTAVSLTFANAALIGAGTFAATSTLIGGATLVHEKASARRRVKKAMKKNLELSVMDFIQPETVLNNGRAVYANGLNPPQRGKGLWSRRNTLYQYLKQNRNRSADDPCSNQALVQRIIDGNETNKFIDLVVLAAKRGYLGDKSREAVKDKENKQKLKELKYLDDRQADQLLEDVFGIQNHFKTLGGYQSKANNKTRKSKQADEEEAYIDAVRDQITANNQPQELTAEQIEALNKYAEAMSAQTQQSAPVEPNSITPKAEEKNASLVKAALTGFTPKAEPEIEEENTEVIEDKSLIKSIVDEPTPAPAVAEIPKVEDVAKEKLSLLEKLSAQTPKESKTIKKSEPMIRTLDGRII